MGPRLQSDPRALVSSPTPGTAYGAMISEVTRSRGPCAGFSLASPVGLVIASIALLQAAACGPSRDSTPSLPQSRDPSTTYGPEDPRSARAANRADVTVDLRLAEEELSASATWEGWWELHKRAWLWPVGASAASQGARDELRGTVVPVLRANLERTGDADIQAGCLIALARLGEAPLADDAFHRFLFGSSQDVGEAAVLALGILGNPDQVPLLRGILEACGDEEGDLLDTERRDFALVSNRSRALAAYSLGLLGSKAAPSARATIQRTLLRMLHGEAMTMEKRDVAVACITASGLLPLGWDPEDDGDLRAEPSTEVATRQGQLRALLALRDDSTISALTRAHVPTAMARLIAADGVPQGARLKAQVIDSLLECLAPDSSAPVAIQQSCALALGLLADGDADPADKAMRATLMSAARGARDPQVRNFASIALAQASGRAGSGADPLYGTRTSNKGENARSYFLSELSRNRTATRAWTALSLGILERALQDAGGKTPAEVRITLRTLASDASRVSDQSAFALACGLVRDREAAELLLGMLGRETTGEFGWTKPDHYVPDPLAGLRRCAAEALGLLGDPAAIEGLRAAWTTAAAGSVEGIAAALHLLGDEQVLDRLQVSIAKPASLRVRMVSCHALGRIGEPRSIDPLAALLSDDQDGGLPRSFAATALGLLADADRVPWSAALATGVNYFAAPPTLLDGLGGVLDLP